MVRCCLVRKLFLFGIAIAAAIQVCEHTVVHQTKHNIRGVIDAKQQVNKLQQPSNKKSVTQRARDTVMLNVAMSYCCVP
jgi:hypothetical protein